MHLVETYFRNIYSNREINRWKRIVNRFVGILKSKIKDLNKFLDKVLRLNKVLNKLIIQTLLHWCYELTIS